MTISAQSQAACHALTSMDTFLREDAMQKIDNAEQALRDAIAHEQVDLPHISEADFAENFQYFEDMRTQVRATEALSVINHIKIGNKTIDLGVDMNGQVSNGGGGKIWMK